MKKPFLGLYARAFCHATEDLDRVKAAVSNAVGEAEVTTKQTVGHHGNPITIVEAAVEDIGGITNFFGRLGEESLRTLLSSLESRVDQGCNLFVRVDKQRAYQGALELATGEDVISVRIRVAAFPARCEIAEDLVRGFVTEELSRRCGKG